MAMPLNKPSLNLKGPRLVNVPPISTLPSSDSMLAIEKLGLTRKQFESFTADKVPAADDNILGWVPDLAGRMASAEGVGVISVCLWLIGSLM